MVLNLLSRAGLPRQARKELLSTLFISDTALAGPGYVLSGFFQRQLPFLETPYEMSHPVPGYESVTAHGNKGELVPRW